MVARGEPRSLVEGTEEHFLAEHYWGYVRRPDGGTTEYRVDHVPWRIWTAGSVDLDCAATNLYGPGFAEALAGTPHSAFLADGSPVTVYTGERLAQG